MCDMHAYILRNEKEELVLEHVDVVESDNGSLRLSNIFGERKVVQGRVKSFSLRDNKIVLWEQS